MDSCLRTNDNGGISENRQETLHLWIQGGRISTFGFCLHCLEFGIWTLEFV